MTKFKLFDDEIETSETEKSVREGLEKDGFIEGLEFYFIKD